MSIVLNYSETLVVVHCWCGIAVGIPDNLNQWAHESKNNEVYCPLGHTFIYGNSYEEKLQKERQSHQATLDLLRAEERSHSATRGQLTKTKKRVAKGVCPCCNRHFVNVERHMANKHPDYESS